jgi:VWFA-related protein
VLIASGLDTFSKRTFDKTRKELQNAGVPIYSIGLFQMLREMADARGYLGSSARLDFMQADNQMRTFATETGGQSFSPRFFGEYPSIFRTINDVQRNQYFITYKPSNQSRDGKYRKIRIELVDPVTGAPLKIMDEKGKPVKYKVVAKPGYTAPREVQ